jgi:hypothetical protein
MLKTWRSTTSTGASIAMRKARATSCTWTSGRHCRPPPITVTSPRSTAWSVMRLMTRSKRMRGDRPNTVALRSAVTQKPSPASAKASRSASRVERA